MSNSDKLGDRVNVPSMAQGVTGSLPHPQDPWGTSSSVEDPYDAAPKFRNRSDVPVAEATAYDPTSPAAQAAPAPAAPAPAQAAPAQAAPAARAPRPLPPTTSATTHESKVISRFREVFGIGRVKEVPLTITRRDPKNTDKNASMVFGVRAVNYEDYQWILEMTQELQQSPRLASFAWKIAFMSMVVCSLDKEPIWKSFGFVPGDPSEVTDPLYPHMGLRFQAAGRMCELFKSAFFYLVDELYTEYESQVDSNYIAKKPKSTEEAAVPLAQSGSES